MKRLLLLALLLPGAALAESNPAHLTLQSAEDHYRAGDREAAVPLVDEAYQALLRADQLDTIEGIHAVRLQLLLDPDPTKARRLLEKTERLFGPDHRETLLSRMALAECLNVTAVDAGPAIELWTACGRQARTLADGDSRELAECLYGLGRAMQEPYSYTVSFAGDPKQPIIPQLEVKEEYTSATLAGLRYVRQAHDMHSALGGAEDPAAGVCKAYLLRTKDLMEKEAWKARQRAFDKIAEELQTEQKQIAEDLLAAWWKDNAPPQIYVCTGESAYAYHLAGCSVLEDCYWEPVDLTTARVRMHRQPCELCNPPLGTRTPPEHLTQYQFNGRVYPLTVPRAQGKQPLRSLKAR